MKQLLVCQHHLTREKHYSFGPFLEENWRRLERLAAIFDYEEAYDEHSSLEKEIMTNQYKETAKHPDYLMGYYSRTDAYRMTVALKNALRFIDNIDLMNAMKIEPFGLNEERADYLSTKSFIQRYINFLKLGDFYLLRLEKSSTASPSPNIESRKAID